VSLFVVSPEIEDREEVEFYRQASHKKKIGYELFFFPAVTLILQFSNWYLKFL
jgi:hypothetical protein